ncbi:MAG: hypothetical protein WC651_00245 [Candidatus Gracilibacteria bacterium]|jgi:hypothetical protein
MSILNKFEDVFVSFLVFALVFFVGVPVVERFEAGAAALTAVSDTLSTNKASTAANHTIGFVTSTGAGDVTDTIVVTFDAGFSLSGSTPGAIAVGDVDLASGANPGALVDKTLAAGAATDSAWGFVISGQTMTFTHPSNAANGDIAEGDLVTIEIGVNAGGTNKIVNSTLGTYYIDVAGTFGDTGDMAVAVVTDPDVDVTATVNAVETLTLTISSTTVTFGALSLLHTKYAGASGSESEQISHTVEVNTSATSGYSLAVTGATLTNGGNNIDAIGGTEVVPTVGTEEFGMRVGVASGTGTASAPYNDVTPKYAYNGVSGLSEIASNSGDDDDTYNIYYMANIADDTVAASYSTALTYVATGMF